METQILVVNQEMLCLFKAALEQKKKVIIVSDMYHSQKTLESILKQKGITGYTKLFVSSEYFVTKRSGELFDVVLKELGIYKSNMIHIGDNGVSDYRSPTGRGIEAIHYKSAFEQYKESHAEELKKYTDSGESLEASAELGESAIRWHTEMCAKSE